MIAQIETDKIEKGVRLMRWQNRSSAAKQRKDKEKRSRENGKRFIMALMAVQSAERAGGNEGGRR